jgi:hypothetical protein
MLLEYNFVIAIVFLLLLIVILEWKAYRQQLVPLTFLYLLNLMLLINTYSNYKI